MGVECRSGQNFITTNSFQFAHFCGYSAIVAIYFFIIKQPSKTNMIKKYLQAAERGQEQISNQERLIPCKTMR
jgi:hypothetical protein